MEEAEPVSGDHFAGIFPLRKGLVWTEDEVPAQYFDGYLGAEVCAGQLRWEVSVKARLSRGHDVVASEALLVP